MGVGGVSSSTPSSSTRQSRNDRMSIDGRSPPDHPAALTGESRKSSPPVIEERVTKYKLPFPEMYKFFDKDMANEKSELLGLTDEEERKTLTKMRRHSIYLDNQLINTMQSVESCRQLCSAKKAMRDIVITRIEHIDNVITDLGKISELTSSSLSSHDVIEIFNNNMDTTEREGGGDDNQMRGRRRRRSSTIRLS